MLSLKECRRILGPDCRLTEEELRELRDQLHELAILAVDAWVEGDVAGADREGYSGGQLPNRAERQAA